MGIAEFRYKVQAFAISSFFAGVAGALFVGLSGRTLATDFGLFLSVEFIAILLIGGAGTTSGAIVGAFVIYMMPQFVEEATKWLSDQESGVTGVVGDTILTEGNDLGFINTSTVTPGWTTFRVRLEHRSLRCPDHRVLDLRTARHVRHLGQDPQLLEALAVQLLSSSAHIRSSTTTDLGPIRDRESNKLEENPMKQLRLLLALLLAFSLVAAACGDDEDSSDSGSDSASTDSDSGSDSGSDSDADDDTADAGGEMLTGAGVDAENKVIRVGLNADLSGTFASLTTVIVEGQLVFWERYNDQGGYNGWTVEPVVLDNAYDVPTHLENYDAFAGDPTIGGHADQLDRIAAHGGDR